MASKRIVVAGGSGFLGTFVEDFKEIPNIEGTG